MATRRFKRGSCAVCTTPTPPWPSPARIAYGPRVEPGASVMGEGRL